MVRFFGISFFLFLITIDLHAQTITVGEDGIVRCKDVPIGTTETIDDVTYEVVDRELLIQRRDEGGDLSKVCVSNVTDMRWMFDKSPFNGDISTWDVSSVTNMSYMFWQSPFNEDISWWNVSSVTDMSYMFSYSQFNKDISGWNVSSVTDMSEMFSSSQFNQDISGWDVSSVTDMFRMFSFSKFNQDIPGWNVSSVTNMYGMFSNSPFNGDISGWDVSSVTDMGSMFRDSPFNQDISGWDVSSVIRMFGMFNDSQFNGDISDWNVSSVTTMDYMFHRSQFNQDISGWCVENIIREPDGFSTNSPLISENKPVWGTCPEQQVLAINLISPEDSTSNIPNIIELKWSSDTLSTTYQLQVYEGADIIVIDTLITDTTFTNEEPFKSNQTYTWKVRGINSTIGEGKWSQTWSFTTELSTSFEDDILPMESSLHQNYPNPFNPTTNITYSLSSAGFVTLNVFDVTGRNVKTLVKEAVGAGTHTVQFNAANLPSGMYIYTLRTGGYTEVRKMLLVK